MATEIRWRRGTQTEHDTFTGAEGEVTVNTSDKRAVVHDGVTAGGHPAAKEDEVAKTANNLSDLLNPATSFTNIKQPATTTATGVVEKATTTEAENAVVDKYPDAAGVRSHGDKRYASITRSRKNLLINGGFDIWQRGTSFTVSNEDLYTSDRWNSNRNGSGQTVEISRNAFSLGQTEVPNNPDYYLRYAVTTAATDETFSLLMQKVEGVETLSGRKAAISFYARADAALSLPSVGLTQVFGTGGTPSANNPKEAAGDISIGTTWQKYVFTIDVPSVSGKTKGTNGDDYPQLYFSLPINIVFGLDIAQVQLEEGDTATDFEQRPIGEELALCQRYFEQGVHRLRDNQSTGTIGAQMPFKVTKRGNPSLTLTVNNGSIVSSSASAESFYVSYNNLNSGNGGSDFTADAEL